MATANTTTTISTADNTPVIKADLPLTPINWRKFTKADVFYPAEPVLDKAGKPVYKAEPVLDEQGEPVLDKAGNAKTEQVQQYHPAELAIAKGTEIHEVSHVMADKYRAEGYQVLVLPATRKADKAGTAYVLESDYAKVQPERTSSKALNAKVTAQVADLDIDNLSEVDAKAELAKLKAMLASK